MFVWVFLFSAIFTFIFTIILYKTFSPKNFSLQVDLLLISTWFSIFFSVVLIPIDIYVVSTILFKLNLNYLDSDYTRKEI